MSPHEKLGSDSIPGLLIGYALPSFIGMMVLALYNIVDRIFIGYMLGSYALAGVSLAFPLFAFVVAVGMLIGRGGGTRIPARRPRTKGCSSRRPQNRRPGESRRRG